MIISRRIRCLSGGVFATVVLIGMSTQVLAARCALFSVLKQKAGSTLEIVEEMVSKTQCEFQAASFNKRNDGWTYSCEYFQKTVDCPGLDPPKK